MDLTSPPLELKIILESNPVKSRILVQRLAVVRSALRMDTDGGRLLCQLGVLLAPVPRRDRLVILGCLLTRARSGREPWSQDAGLAGPGPDRPEVVGSGASCYCYCVITIIMIIRNSLLAHSITKVTIIIEGRGVGRARTTAGVRARETALWNFCAQRV